MSEWTPMLVELAREHSRRWIACGLVALLAAAIILGFITLWFVEDVSDAAVGLLVTPIVGLVGTATGFYFGGAAAEE